MFISYTNGIKWYSLFKYSKEWLSGETGAPGGKPPHLSHQPSGTASKGEKVIDLIIRKRNIQHAQSCCQQFIY